MPAKDVYHNVVLNALKKDDWTITDDPLTLQIDESVNVYLDIGAENILAAEKQGQRIAVEVKSFIGKSYPTQLYQAIGQYIAYREFLAIKDSARKLYLAIPKNTYKTHFNSDFTLLAIRNVQMSYLVYDINTETILTWQI